jgi:hypothetical protein
MLTLRLIGLLSAALFVDGCASNQSREIVRVDSFDGKTLQLSPYEVTTYAWLHGISRADIHAIEVLVAQHREIRKGEAPSAGHHLSGGCKVF